MDGSKIYEELALSWRHFASWREKVFAGYLTVLAALVLALVQSPSPVLPVMTFSGAILVSVVFWILDLRSGQLINVCQIAAAQLENPKGVFTALNALRFGASTWWASYGFAIDLLVAGVIGASAGGLYRSISRPSGPGIGSVAAAISVGMFLSIVVLSRRLRNKDWSSAKANSEAKAIPESVRY